MSELKAAQVFDRWRSEDRELEACLDGLRGWMLEVQQRGVPQFGETAEKLTQVKEQWLAHIASEREMIDELGKLYERCSPEISAVRRQSQSDHANILTRMDDLIARFSQPEPPFSSWTAAMDEVDLFVCAVEQHEESESDHVEMLLPGCDEDSLL
jgi:hypothetical protein